MKNVLIIGATSSMGQIAAKYFLNKTDDNITLMARYTGLLTIDESRERVFQGDIIDEGILNDAMTGMDVVLVTLDSMDKNRVKRLIFLTSMGTSNEIPTTTGASGNLTEDEILAPYKQVNDVIGESDLNYTIVRLSWLDDGEDIDNYEITHNGVPAVEDEVSRGSVADLIVRLAHDDKLGARDNLAISRKA